MKVEYNRSDNAIRPWISLGYYSNAAGRSYYRVRCPFCASEFKAYAWSIRGGGKKCENPRCGAMHSGWGYAAPVVGREPTLEGKAP